MIKLIIIRYEHMCEEKEQAEVFSRIQTFDAFHCFVIDENFHPYSTFRVAEVIMMRLDH
jgi:hypothetical protein